MLLGEFCEEQLDLEEFRIKQSFIYSLYDTLISILGDSYPELIDKRDYVVKVIKSEEESFGKTLDRGLIIFEEICSELNGNQISGEDVFKLYDTYGFPLDLTQLLAQEKISIDEEKFHFLMNEQKDKVRQSNKFKLDNQKIDWTILKNTTKIQISLVMNHLI